ncbi:hypothetical protein DOTSEDRAFT_163364 [Lecanosticta acicola]|uniref:Uncharacterized protein n=1 Tax=Lecanosticta acicola TaxID=111012 RepID=A0AAI9EC26_9PEZI|nr:hypothetical protein DOTSEDRAFT_163364 [Lecanosticta acicola]
MASGKPKQWARPAPKKKPAKTDALVTADDFQDAADFEESAGGKHRVGDPVKSGRAFVRALHIYDRGLQKHPHSFDLAYNKARLQLEISQQANLVEHIGVPLVEWLQTTLESHRYALQLNQDNPDVLFNTAQILTSLAEQLSEDDRQAEARTLLQEALELLSSCLSRQEIMLEQHKLDFPDTEEGGVPLEPQDQPSPAPAPSSSQHVDMGDEQSATVETPVGPVDLLDTVHASLSALTTLVPLVDESDLQNLGDMAQALTETKAPGYIPLLPAEDQTKEVFAIALDRATFIAAFANVQFEAQVIGFQTYLERLDTFDVPGKEEDVNALCSEAQARTELVMSALDRFDEPSELPSATCWKQLTLAQDLYSKATRLTSEEAQERKADIYQTKGDLELLRHRIANVQKADLSDAIRKSAPTLVQNAQTYYKGAVSHAKASEDEEVEEDAQQRWDLAKHIAAVMYGNGSPTEDVEGLSEALEGCVEEGLVSSSMAQALTQSSFASRS